jgi:molybdenum-dependent DNA-binding transcriptional regulator ModE
MEGGALFGAAWKLVRKEVKMIEDPIVEEIRRYRMEHAAQYGNDLKRIVQAYQEMERASGREYVNFETKRVPATRASEEAAPYNPLTEGTS